MTELEPIQVRQYGSNGRTVVVLHGGPGAPGSAVGLARLLAKEFQVLEPLQRRSRQVPLTMSQHVQDLAEVAPPVGILVGHSFGAMLALSYASRHPSRVARVMLIGCGTYNEQCREKMKETLTTRLGDAGNASLRELRVALERAKDAGERNAIMRKLGAVFSLLESYELMDETEKERDHIEMDARGHEETWQDVLKLQAQEFEPQIFAEIKVPVMLIQGDTDPHPGPMTRDLLKRVMPQLEYWELERCGHEPWRERFARDSFTEVLRIWLNR